VRQVFEPAGGWDFILLFYLLSPEYNVQQKEKEMQQTKQSIIDIIKSCDIVIMATFGMGQFPDARHLANTMNKNARDLSLHFFTNIHSEKYQQLVRNPNCCLYYFNPDTRHVMRLFGKMELVSDAGTRAAMWNDDFQKFGYSDAADKNFALLRFIPDSYKFYIGDEMKTGRL